MTALRAAFLAGLLAVAGPALAEFRAIAVEQAVLYDAPSLEARKLFVLTRHYPVEIIVSLEKWAKVRDAGGELAWVEKSKLADKRMVLVTAPLAEIRSQPNATAAVVFQAERDVVLELIEFAPGGWVRVKHPDGQVGFLPVSQAWGA